MATFGFESTNYAYKKGVAMKYKIGNLVYEHNLDVSESRASKQHIQYPLALCFGSN
jgi:hypothetical protein